jgi:lactate permease
VHALAAAAPLLTLLVLLGIVRMRAYRAGLISLALGVILAVTMFHLPLREAVSGATEGAAFGLFPIVWIILNAVWINKLQHATRYFDVVGRTFSSLSADRRIQALLVAYCFGAMIESISGFGTPIAVTSVMLVALGLNPMRAAVVALFANTAPAAFGSLGNPIQGLAKVTSFPEPLLGQMVGRQSAIIAALVPFALLLLLDGRRGLRQLWPAASVAGLGFGAGQLLCSNLFAYQLTDLSAAVVSTLALMVLLHFWKPPREAAEPANDPPPQRDSRRDIAVAFSPYVVLVGLYATTAFIGPVQRAVARTGFSFTWPGLHLKDRSGKPLPITMFDFQWLSSSGTILLITGIATACILGVSAKRALGCYGRALEQIRWAIISISVVLALSYVMNLSGMAHQLGVWAAGTGSAFALLSGVLGWFGVVLTGSDTSSNVLFGAMQVSAAHRVGVSPLLMAATNSSGGVQGKAVAMQNLVLAASAVGLQGREGDILRKVLWCSVILLLGLCVLAWLQTNALSPMVPGS